MKASNGIDVDRRPLSLSLMVVAGMIASLSSFLWLPAPSWSSDLFRSSNSSSSDLPSLHSAVFKGQGQTVQKLLSQGADVNGRDRNGNTALMYAALGGHTQIVDLLLMSRADVNAQNAIGVTALYDASFQGYTEIVQRLLEKGADASLSKFNGETPLGAAANFKDPTLVQALLKAGADPDQNNPLWVAAGVGDVSVVHLLLSAGAKVEQRTPEGETALIRATIYGHTEVVRTLLAAGANIDARITAPSAMLEYVGVTVGDTALKIALRKGRLKIALLLLRSWTNL